MASAAYTRFLASSDLATWRDCLSTMAELAPGKVALPALDGERLTEVLVISTYVSWLARNSDPQLMSSAERIRQLCYRRVEELLRGEPSAASRVAGLVALAGMGYMALARRDVPDEVLAEPAMFLLFEPDDAAATSAQLGRFVSSAAGTSFWPAVFRYGDALSRLGAFDRVRALVQAHAPAPDDPLALELLGSIAEQLGDFAEAGALYARSSWSVHRSSSLVCAQIQQREADPSCADEIDAVALTHNRGAVGAAELARAQAFVHACRFRTFDHWLVHLELGNLALAQRRHQEAQRRFLQAAAAAPRAQRFAPLHMRFISLTWLEGASLTSGVDMLLEALAAGHEALASEGRRYPEDDAQIRLWLVGKRESAALLEPVLAHGATADKAAAYNLLGRAPEAIDHQLATMVESHAPRTLLALIERCHRCKLDAAACWLAELAEREAQRSFPELWELACNLRDLGIELDASESARSRLSAIFVRCAQRLEPLSRYDFGNCLRAFEFFASVAAHEYAESTLNRAAKLAECSEEHLRVAGARLSSPRARGLGGDRQGLSSLLRAERESRERLERLQIARLLYLYDQPARARRLLLQEGVIGRPAEPGRPRLRAAESIVLLGCGRFLPPSEVTTIAREALDELRHEALAGVLNVRVEGYFERLWGALLRASETVAMALRDEFEQTHRAVRTQVAAVRQAPEAAIPALAASPEASAWSRLTGLDLDANPYAGLLFEAAVSAARQGSVGLRIALWQLVSQRVFEGGEQLEDNAEPNESRSELLTQELCDLWRQAFAVGERTAQLDAFYQRWGEQQRKLQQAKLAQEAASARAAQRWCQLGVRLLEALREVAPPRAQQPCFDGFYLALAEDGRRLEGELVRTAHELAARCALSSLGAVHD